MWSRHIRFVEFQSVAHTGTGQRVGTQHRPRREWLRPSCPIWVAVARWSHVPDLCLGDVWRNRKSASYIGFANAASVASGCFSENSHFGAAVSNQVVGGLLSRCARKSAPRPITAREAHGHPEPVTMCSAESCLTGLALPRKRSSSTPSYIATTTIRQ